MMKMNNDLEFHYVVSYRDGYGWSISVDTEDALFNEGTIYDWSKDGSSDAWFFAYEDSNDPENSSIADLDTIHYRMLKSAINLMNEGAVSNA